MTRIFLTAIAVCALSVSPALSKVSHQQQKQIQKRESTGESNMQNQIGGLKKDRRISHAMFRNANASMRKHHSNAHR